MPEDRFNAVVFLGARGIAERSNGAVQRRLEQCNASDSNAPGTKPRLEHHLRVHLPELRPTRKGAQVGFHAVQKF